MVAGLVAASAAVAEAVLRASLHGGAAAAAAWLFCRCWKRMPPRIAVWTWRLVLLRFLVALVARPWEVVLPAEWAALDATRCVFGGATSVAASPAAAASHTAWIGPAAGAVWLLAAAFGLGMLAWAAMQGAARLRLLPRCRHERTLQTADELASRMGLRRRPQVRVSLEAESPCLAGVWSPVVVAPSPWSFPSLELRLIFAHEFAHLRRGDVGWTWASAVVSRLFFFHPLAWLAARRLRVAQELAADQAAVAAVEGRTAELGGLLVKMAQWTAHEDRPLALAMGASSGCAALMERLRALQGYRAPQAERRLPAVFAGLAAAASLGAVWTPASPRPAPAAESTAFEHAAATGRRAPTIILSHPRDAAAQTTEGAAPIERDRRPPVGGDPAGDAGLAEEFKARLQLLEALGFCPDAVSLRATDAEGLAVWQLELRQRRLETPLDTPPGTVVAAAEQRP